jgi:RNA polymerase sigma-70 factor (ECF subfamily)
LTEIKDIEILKLFRTKGQKEKAFLLLVEKYQERLYWHIRKIVIIHEDADDVIQNTFVKIWRNLEGFKSNAQLYTWLYKIATNEALSWLKIKKKNSIVNYEEFLVNSLPGDEYFDGEKLELKLQKAILSLPERQRLVFNMRYFDELKYEEIAEILDLSTGALKASYHHARKKIEEFFKNG